MDELIRKALELFKKPLFLKAAVGAGLIIMVLIAMYDGKPKKADTPEINPDIHFVSSDLYAAQMEDRLRDVLMSIKGVGKAEVLLTLTSTEEFVYVETVKKSGAQAEVSYVILDKGSQKEALVRKVNKPAVNGVIIVCEGGGNSKTSEKIHRAVSTALGIPTNRIFVAEMK
ncbi:MAG: hypothetical protein FWG90_02510 [Oscillospiraceae bacterium]|nr:hypothetical protein [Oscillospiraceae bacterium]